MSETPVQKVCRLAQELTQRKEQRRHTLDVLCRLKLEQRERQELKDELERQLEQAIDELETVTFEITSAETEDESDMRRIIEIESELEQLTKPLTPPPAAPVTPAIPAALPPPIPQQQPQPPPVLMFSQQAGLDLFRTKTDVAQATRTKYKNEWLRFCGVVEEFFGALEIELNLVLQDLDQLLATFAGQSDLSRMCTVIRQGLEVQLPADQRSQFNTRIYNLIAPYKNTLTGQQKVLTDQHVQYKEAHDTLNRLLTEQNYRDALVLALFGSSNFPCLRPGEWAICQVGYGAPRTPVAPETNYLDLTSGTYYRFWSKMCKKPDQPQCTVPLTGKIRQILSHLTYQHGDWLLPGGSAGMRAKYINQTLKNLFPGDRICTPYHFRHLFSSVVCPRLPKDILVQMCKYMGHSPGTQSIFYNIYVPPNQVLAVGASGDLPELVDDHRTAEPRQDPTPPLPQPPVEEPELILE